MSNMSAVFIVAVLATFAACDAACNGGVAPSGSRVIFEATRQLHQVGNNNVICFYNLCHQIDIKIERVDFTGGDWSCRSGGIGDFKLEINVNGGDSRNFTAKIWASGKDVGKVINPTNPKGWPCIIEKLYQPRP